MKKNLKEFEKTINKTFKDPLLLKQAFTHRSYINEQKDTQAEHNERFEFLGDAVLELVITDFLYHKYPKSTEGDLTSYRAALVNTHTLSKVATTLHVNDFLLLSKGEAKDTGRARQYILADTMEAIIGALYLDLGYDNALGFIYDFIAPLTEEIIESGSWLDAKSRFQEVAQEKTGITPTYKLLNEEGPDHDKHFTVGVYLDDNVIAEGKGNSKQEAEQEAAENALQEKGWK